MLITLQHGMLGELMQMIKSRSSIAINPLIKHSGQVWQRGDHDHALRKDEDIKAHARYIIANPLRANLVTRVGDYPLWDATWL